MVGIVRVRTKRAAFVFRRHLNRGVFLCFKGDFMVDIPIDANNKPIQIIGNKALAVTVDATVSSATDITLNASTKLIRVFAKDQGLYIRSQATASASNWDWFCPANQVLDIGVPSKVTVISVIEEAATAKAIISEY